MIKTDVLGVILGGGRGSRLWPLTKQRAKPAVPIGGKYRLVDIPLSNCLNAGISHIAVLTQFNSVSLHRHISQTYNFDVFHKGWVQILAAEQTLESADWYQGTADAVRKQLLEIQVTGAEHVIILAGDHLYRMDYGQLLQFHKHMDADVTVAVKPVSASEGSRFGILKLAKDDRITTFIEKPEEPDALTAYVSRDDSDRPFIGSMGIYAFKLPVLMDLLDSDYDDFGADVIPAAIASRRVYGYTFDGYWQDIGTIRAFYDAHLALTQAEPPFHFDDPVAPIYTRPRFLPGSRIYDIRLDRVTLADGCIIKGAEIQRSVIGIRSVIGEDVILRDSVMMGADYYEEESDDARSGAPLIGIGRGSQIQGAIIDKNARIGAGVVIEPFPNRIDVDEESWSVHDGIVIIPKNAVLQDGTVIRPE
ncbi:MAG: glucose-1-phosphate adenylyltransferase [Anaerolineales bacterium]|nr:MAG: glucose-1-phosphate adenylyltransferase [Anaerolineales bacterium]